MLVSDTIYSGLDNDLTLRLFRNERTEAAKVVCTVGGNGSSWNNGRRNSAFRYKSALDATLLTIKRDGSAIHLMRRNILWAVLYFVDYEMLTLFYHIFLALRYNAPNAPLQQESELWLDGEELIFSA